MLLTRKRAIVAAIEGTYGNDAGPTGAANAILISSPNIMPLETTMAARDLIKQYLGNEAELLAAVYAKCDFEVEIAGAGAAGTAPAWGPLMRACGYSQTILAVAHASTATAGAAASITLGVTASGTNDAYAGMTIRTIGGTGPGQYAVIKAYNGTTKVATLTADWDVTPDATTTYSIDAQVLYKPVSESFESITIYFNVDGVLHKMLGARGNVSHALTLLGVPRYKFEFTGIYVPVVDAVMPTLVLTAFQTPVPVNSTNTVRLILAGYPASVAADITFDTGNSVVFRSLINADESVAITDRKSTGQISQEATKVADKDWWAQIRTGVLGVFSVTHGTTPGNIVKFDCPAVQLTKPAYADKDGVTMLGTAMTLIPVTGNDELTISVM